MTRVITYGTFDLFHEGHRRLLERAKALGDELIVGVTSDEYDIERGKLNVRQSVVERMKNVVDSGFADRVIIEGFEGQKVQDVQRYGVDIFAIGSDWTGQFDYLGDYCRVVYLDRTRGISSTELRNAERIVRLGIVGTGRIAHRMIAEARLVSGVSVQAVCNPTAEHSEEFARAHELERSFTSVGDMCGYVDAVYVASPHRFHYDHAWEALTAGRHVLCEKPMALSPEEAIRLFALADSRDLVLLEAVKTAFAPAFLRLVSIARSGSIGDIRSVDATFTKLIGSGRELTAPDGGSITELATYPLLAAIKLLGDDPCSVSTVSLVPPGSEVDTFARIDLRYPHAVASARVGIGVKAEGQLIIAGSLGYIWVPAPWWLTEYFETRCEGAGATRRYYSRFEGDGLRYELAEFASMIHDHSRESYKLRPRESIALSRIISEARTSAWVFD